MQVDWSKAPEWAKWHAFDECGKGYWFECIPSISKNISVWDNEYGGRFEPSDEYIGYCEEWKHSKTKRPDQHTNNDQTAAAKNKHTHYHKPTNGIEAVDVYWVLNAWEVDCHAIGHAVKKLLNAGQRGVKTKEQDLREAIDSIERAIELLE